MKQCRACLRELNIKDKTCKFCGTSTAERYTEFFNRSWQNQNQFIAEINGWLSENPRMANLTCKFYYKAGFGFLGLSAFLNGVEFEYELLEGENKNQYAVDRFRNIKFFRRISQSEAIGEWYDKHPNAKIVRAEEGTGQLDSSFHVSFGGVGRNIFSYVYFILYKYSRDK